MSFFALVDYKHKSKNINKYLSLRVDKDKGIETVPDMDINITTLNKKGKSHYNQFFNNGYGGITFKITVPIKYAVTHKGKTRSYKKSTTVDMHDYTEDIDITLTDMWGDKPVIQVLHNWYINMTPVNIVSSAIDVPDGRYIITKNPTRKQNFKNTTVWELEFTTYTPLALYKYKNSNANVKKAIKQNKKLKKRALNNQLKKCGYKVLVYSKKKKTVKCVKTLQKVLKREKVYTGKIDGWYGKDTKKAVKQFQKNYNKKYTSKTVKAGQGVIKAVEGKIGGGKYSTSNVVTLAKKGTTVLKATTLINKVIPEDGKVDKRTFNALCKS